MIKNQKIKEIERNDIFDEKHHIYDMLMRSGFFPSINSGPLFEPGEQEICLSEERGVYVFDIESQDFESMRRSYLIQSSVMKSDDKMLRTPQRLIDHSAADDNSQISRTPKRQKSIDDVNKGKSF